MPAGAAAQAQKELLACTNDAAICTYRAAAHKLFGKVYSLRKLGKLKKMMRKLEAAVEEEEEALGVPEQALSAA